MTEVANHESDSDAELLGAVARGDRVAFERLYRQHHARLARFLVHHTAQRDLVDEIINETFWVVWRNAHSFRGDSKISTWIVGIAYRCMLKALRSQPAAPAHSTSAEQPSPDESNHAESESDQRELRDWLQRGLSLLPPDQRMTIELAYYLGQSCEEIAAIMDCAVGTVKARLFHARVRLRNTLPALGGDFPDQASVSAGHIP